jgi:hypothetical protein
MAKIELGSIFDEPSESDTESGETDTMDDSEALAEELLLAVENKDAKALAGILRSLRMED